jgi:ribonuclease HI
LSESWGNDGCDGNDGSAGGGDGVVERERVEDGDDEAASVSSTNHLDLGAVMKAVSAALARGAATGDGGGVGDHEQEER